MVNRELLMLAKTFDPSKHDVGGWSVSEKYDGQRCFWDGGVSRGILKKYIPWANTDKDERYVTPPKATGLWSRYGNVINAPDTFLDQLPTNVFLDGELWQDRGMFQSTRSIISKIEPNPTAWEKIKFLVFDTPSYDMFTYDGRINTPNFSKIIDGDACREFLGDSISKRAAAFKYVELPKTGILTPVVQRVLPERNWLDTLYEWLDEVVSQGGEGLMVRDPISYWEPYRSSRLLKVKPLERDTGIVIEYTTGLGKYDGMLGAIVVEWNGVVFELSGFTDEERTLPPDLAKWASQNPAARFDRSIIQFPIGSSIDFKYTGLTRDGIPREARYARS